MPLTVEPSKPRLCNDNRFLNLWMVDKPFHLDRLPGILRYVTKDSFQSVTNDKSGYDHVFLTSRSRTFLFVACFTLTSLEYFIGLQKCILFPRQEVPNTLIPVKKAKFLALLRGILQRDIIEVVGLQKLAGKCNSMSLAIPGGRLFTNEMNLAISQGVRSSRPVKISPSLCSEMQHWLFLENWEGHLPWLSERHSHTQLCTDASSFGWGGVLSPGTISASVSDYWGPGHISLGIAPKEAFALANVLKSFRAHISNVFTDSAALIHALPMQGSKSEPLFNALKDIFAESLRGNILLNLHYVPSLQNPADAP